MTSERKTDPGPKTRRATRQVMRLAAFLLLASVAPARAQFKEIREAPFPPSEAPQKIRILLESADRDNRNQTVATLLGWSDWYRDILDRELIERWKGDLRGNLTLVMHDLADSRVASEIVEFSWRQRRPVTFRPEFASTLGDLMARYPDSARPFLDDLRRGQPSPSLSPPETETVCKILLDMPDIGTWRKSALEILPRYRQMAGNLLARDMNGPDQERTYRADTWLHDLGWRHDVRSSDSGAVSTRQISRPAASASPPRVPVPPPANPMPEAVRAADLPVAGPKAAPTPRSGTLESAGGPIPQNGEYVFRDLPPVKMQLQYDTKHWEARLEPGSGQTQRLVVRNKGDGPQKRCVVHWTAVP